MNPRRFLLACLGLLSCLPAAAQTPAAPIIADHHAVAAFDDIPPHYLAQVRQMLVYVAGESHSTAYCYGPQLLAAQSAAHPAVGAMMNDIQYFGDPNPSYPAFDPANPRLRVIRGYGGEDGWFTNAQTVNTVIPPLLQRYNSQGVTAIGFGWCWDMTWIPYAPNRASAIDPVYRVHWSGRSVSGPQGDICWGLDAEDQAITGNAVNMDTYLTATQSYVDYCTTQGLAIKPFLTTGPVDDSDDHIGYDQNEKGYARELKHARIRAWVTAHNGILFDFADILSHNNAGQAATGTWTDDLGRTRTFPVFHTDNGVVPFGDYHFGEVGAVRVAKAMWWMLARMAGWDGTSGGTPDTQAPSIPTSLVATATAPTTVTLTWTASTDNVGVTGYRISRATGSSTPAQIATTPGTAYTNTDLTAATQYTYTVDAYDQAGNVSDPSTAITVTTQAPPSGDTVLHEGFESPVTATYLYNPTATWQFVGNSGVQRNGSAWEVPNAPEGVQTAFLQSDADGHGPGAIQRTVAFPAGVHTITLLLARRLGQVQPLRLTVDGTQIGTLLTPTSNDFALYTTASFTVTAGNHTVRLEATAAGADRSTMVDDLRIIQQNPATYTTWRATNFGADAGNDTLSGPDADPDGAGVTNFQRYAHALPARGPVANPVTLSTAETTAGRVLNLTFPRRAAATDLSYVVESSPDLVIWTPIPGRTYAPGADPITAEDVVALADSTTARRFLRVRVTTP